MKRILKKTLGIIGLDVVRVRSHADHTEDGGDIEPLLRNKVVTLDRLWSDPAFRRKYLSRHRLHLYEEVYRCCISRKLFDAGQSVLDAGCGPGFFIADLLAKGVSAQLSGCDFSQAAIDFAKREQPEIEWFVHDMYQPLGRNYTGIICMETLEHLLYPDKALRLLAQCAPSLVLTVPEGRKDSFRGHINFWSKESFEVLLTSLFPDRQVRVAECNAGKNLLAEVYTP
jgi:SAM-dependent methyltransferase